MLVMKRKLTEKNCYLAKSVPVNTMPRMGCSLSSTIFSTLYKMWRQPLDNYKIFHIYFSKNTDMDSDTSKNTDIDSDTSIEGLVHFGSR
jgi:hypothetical protein